MGRTICSTALVLLTLLASVLAGGCSDRADREECPPTGACVGPTPPPAPTVSQAEVFGGLTVELIVPPSVRAGDSLEVTMRVENRSGGPVTDPGCELAAARFGLLPVEDPDGWLWQGYTVDCGGPHTYEPGASEEYRGFSFRATGPSGTPLAPGDHLAVWEVDGERLQYPVTVEP